MLVSQKTAGMTTTASAASGGVLAISGIMEWLTANSVALGLIISFCGLCLGAIFYTLNYFETKRHHREMEKSRK